MKKIFFLFLIINLSVKGQNTSEELTFKRGFITTKVYKNNILLSTKKQNELYKNESLKKALRFQNISKYTLFVGPPVTLGGIYLAYDAIRGTRMSVYENGQELVYYERPIFQLIGGVFVFTAGICLIEYSNEYKQKAVGLYNAKKLKKPVKVGVLPSGRFGFSIGL